MDWIILDTGVASAEDNMKQDLALLEGLSISNSPTLRFYQWEAHAATYGYFIEPFVLLNQQSVHQRGLQLARRPTGGGLVFHLTDFTFSLVIPASYSAYSSNTLESYAFVNRIVARVIYHFLKNKEKRRTHPILWTESCDPQEKLCLKEEKSATASFCMAKPTKYDVVIGGKKIGGAAQRRTRWGFLHQGTISLVPPPWQLLQEWILDQNILEAMKQNAFYLEEEAKNKKEKIEQLLFMREELKKIFKEGLISKNGNSSRL